MHEITRIYKALQTGTRLCKKLQVFARHCKIFQVIVSHRLEKVHLKCLEIFFLNIPKQRLGEFLEVFLTSLAPNVRHFQMFSQSGIDGHQQNYCPIAVAEMLLVL